MKKFITVLLGLTMAFGTAALSLAGETPPQGAERKSHQGKHQGKGKHSGKGKGKRHKNGGNAGQAAPAAQP